MRILGASVLLTVGTLAGLTTLATYGFAKVTKTGEAKVSFTATGPGGLRIVGTGRQLDVADAGDRVTVTVGLATLDTQIELRNKHMREKYLEVDKYPQAELSVARSELKPGVAEGDAQGTMRLHGQSKPVRFHYVTKSAGSAKSVTGTVRINMKDYGIAEPSFMGVSVKPDVDVEAVFSIKDE